MMNRIKELATERAATSLEKANDIKIEWEDTQRFLFLEEDKKHLNIDELDTTNCCRYALCGPYERYHSDQSCVRCVSSANFASIKLSLVLRNLSIFQFNIKDHRKVQSMHRSVCILDKTV